MTTTTDLQNLACYRLEDYARSVLTADTQDVVLACLRGNEPNGGNLMDIVYEVADMATTEDTPPELIDAIGQLARPYLLARLADIPGTTR